MVPLPDRLRPSDKLRDRGERVARPPSAGWPLRWQRRQAGEPASRRRFSETKALRPDELPLGLHAVQRADASLVRGEAMVDEIDRLLNDAPLQYEVTAEQAGRLA